MLEDQMLFQSKKQAREKSDLQVRTRSVSNLNITKQQCRVIVTPIIKQENLIQTSLLDTWALETRTMILGLPIRHLRALGAMCHL